LKPNLSDWILLMGPGFQLADAILDRWMAGEPAVGTASNILIELAYHTARFLSISRLASRLLFHSSWEDLRDESRFRSVDASLC
jgi:hypothetical protein